MISARDPTPPPIKPIPGQSIKFPKGRKNGIARKNLQRTQTNDKEIETQKGPFVAPTHYEIHWDPEAVGRYMRAWEAKGYFKLKPEKLSWSPYLLTWTRAEEKEKQEKEKESMAATGTSGATGSVEATDKAVNGMSNGNVNANFNGTESPSVTTFRSPLGIFDDEIVDEVLPVSPAKTKAKTKTKSKSTTSPTPEVVQPDADQIPEAEASPEPEKSPQKRLRSRSNQPSTMSTPKRVIPLVVEEPRTTRAGRKSPTKPRPVDGDEAFAAKLALEEQMQGRKLRSRPSGAEFKRTASAPMATTTTPRTLPPRKRQRVDSPPETEETPSPMTQSEFPALVNGNHTDGKVLDLEANKLAAMLFADEAVPMPIITPPPQEAQWSGTAEEPAKTEAIAANDNDEPEDVKSEDLGTPLTSMTSRQSLPSEDTVVTAETEHEKDPAPPEIVVELAGPIGPSVGASEAEEGPSEPNASAGAETDADADADIDADADADADGEYEEDAEGEPDGEGEMEMEEGTS